LSFDSYGIHYPTPETLYLEIFVASIVDGTGRELKRELIHLAKRLNGDVVKLDTHWLTNDTLQGTVVRLPQMGSSLLVEAISAVRVIRDEVKKQRAQQVERKARFLHRTFEEQIAQTLDRITQLQTENFENRNSALINQLNATLIDLEVRRDERIAEVEREANIIAKPAKSLLRLELLPNGNSTRLIPTDWIDVVERYEHHYGRRNVRAYNAFSLVDFISESPSGDVRFIILAEVDKWNLLLTPEFANDTADIRDRTYIYLVNDGTIISERSMVTPMFSM